jgi:putative tryptophan/tyrosine transport system substrate-binding protein
MRRREFITGLSSAAALPLIARAQQPTVPLVGYLTHVGLVSPAFLDGLAETGHVVGRNVRIETRFADDTRQLPGLAAELVRLQPAVISADGSAEAIALKAATSTIPIVFGTGDDPVRLGLVASLSHPGGNLTGYTNLNVELEEKRLAMMHSIIPPGQTIAALVDANNPAAERQASDIMGAARNLGRKVRMLRAANERDIEAAFKTIVQEHLDALFVAADAYFATQRDQFAMLASYNAIPSFYSRREFAEAGGLVSYGTDIYSNYHGEGLYVGRILKGERPGDLPVVQSTKFELVINLKTARPLGITFPTNILALADAVIE